jgi:hypothetical protein
MPHVYICFSTYQVLVSTPVPDPTKMNVCLQQLFLNQPQYPETSTNRLIRFNLKNLIHYLRLYVDKKKKEKSKQTNASNPWKQQLLLFVKIPPHISTSLQKISVHIAPLFNYLLYGCKSLTCPARSFSSYNRYPCRLALHCLLHNFLWTRNIDSPSMSLCIPVEV